MPRLDLEDTQGLIARGYPNLPVASYVLLRVHDGVSARAWLGGLVARVTPAPEKPADQALNLAVTANGLRRLGVPPEIVAGFSNEFTAGMTTPHRQRILGDVDASAPDKWAWGGPTTPTVDVLLMLFARDEAGLREGYATLAGSFAAGGVSEIGRLDSLYSLGGREHFGFVDGISQPIVEGLSSRVDVPQNTVRAGEFILGYPNEYGLYTERPLLDRGKDPGRILPDDEQGSGRGDLGRNGAYVVFRQLAQDVSGFRRFVDEATRGADGASDPNRRTWLAAKMVGRWPDGAPLVLAPEADDPRVAGANDFAYHDEDELGLKCPIGAHVRRAHPRDSLDPSPGTDQSVAIDKRHRLLRRGREYGPPYDPAAPGSEAEERGLYFICVVANIARQFEFVQQTWLNNPTFGGMYDCPDPLVANRRDGVTFSVPADPVRLRFGGLPSFVAVRGGGYFFLPGIRALRYLAGSAG